MAFDFKKEYKGFYMPGNTPEIATVPQANYIAVRGKGNPNEEGGAYQQVVGILYAIAYTLKMSYKSDYKIEGFWWQDGVDGCDYSNGRLHHEIYMSDARKVTPEKWKTVIRHPICKVCN